MFTQKLNSDAQRWEERLHIPCGCAWRSRSWPHSWRTPANKPHTGNSGEFCFMLALSDHLNTGLRQPDIHTNNDDWSFVANILPYKRVWQGKALCRLQRRTSKKFVPEGGDSYQPTWAMMKLDISLWRRRVVFPFKNSYCSLPGVPAAFWPWVLNESSYERSLDPQSLYLDFDYIIFHGRGGRGERHQR